MVLEKGEGTLQKEEEEEEEEEEEDNNTMSLQPDGAVQMGSRTWSQDPSGEPGRSSRQGSIVMHASDE